MLVSGATGPVAPDTRSGRNTEEPLQCTEEVWAGTSGAAPYLFCPLYWFSSIPSFSSISHLKSVGWSRVPEVLEDSLAVCDFSTVMDECRASTTDVKSYDYMSLLSAWRQHPSAVVAWRSIIYFASEARSLTVDTAVVVTIFSTSSLRVACSSSSYLLCWLKERATRRFKFSSRCVHASRSRMAR